MQVIFEAPCTFVTFVCKKDQLFNTFQKLFGRHSDRVGQYKKNFCKMFTDFISSTGLQFYEFAVAQVLKLAKVVGVLDEAGHATFS